MFLWLVANACSLSLFSWHFFASNFTINWDLQTIIWLLELGKSSRFIFPPTHIKSFFTIGVSVESNLFGVKIGPWTANYNHLGIILTNKFFIKLIWLFQVLEMLVNWNFFFLICFFSSLPNFVLTIKIMQDDVLFCQYLRNNAN